VTAFRVGKIGLGMTTGRGITLNMIIVDSVFSLL